MSVSVEKQQQPGQPTRMFGEDADKPAGSPLPTMNVLRSPSELLNINQLLQDPLKSVLAEKTTAADVPETRSVSCPIHSGRLLAWPKH